MATSEHEFRRRAQASEADADAFPDDRAECLLEAAWAWRKAGEPQRTLDLLAEWPAWPDPVDAGLARVESAEIRLEMGQQDVAAAELAALRRERPPIIVCNAAGELHEMRGELQEALRWFDLGLSMLSADQIDELRGPDGWRSEADLIVVGRRRVRQALNLPPDATDLAVPERPAIGADWPGDAGGSTPGQVLRAQTPGRNDPCGCGSGRKYKKCCLRADQ